MSLKNRSKGLFWDYYALFYDSLRGLLPYQELLSRTIKELCIEKEKSIRILDAGCGTGNLAGVIFASQRDRVVLYGIDGSSAMLQRAKHKSLRCDGKIYHARGDLNEQLPYVDSSFDCTVSLNVLYALQDPQRVLQEFWRVMKFGGLLVLANPRVKPKMRDVILAHIRMAVRLDWSKGLSLFVKNLFSFPLFLFTLVLNFLIIKRRAAKNQYHFFNAESLEVLLKNAGFRILNSELAYGNTDIFIVATKILSHTNEQGDLLTAEVAHSKEDFVRIYRLRYNVYCEEMGSLDPRDYPDKLERDRYDPFAVHFLLRKDDEIIGILRLIPETPWGFLMEEAFLLPSNLDRARILEASRLVLQKSVRGYDFSRLLDEAAELWSLEHGYTMWCLTMQIHLFSKRKARGWNIKKLGGVARYHNTEIIPVLRYLIQT